MYLNYNVWFLFIFSVLTPYYKEDVLYSEEDLNKENEDGISILFYLQKIYPGTFFILVRTSYSFFFIITFKFTEWILRELDEWTNYLDRLKDPKLPEKDKSEFLREWVSYRGQTLARTGTNDYNGNHNCS